MTAVENTLLQVSLVCDSILTMYRNYITNIFSVVTCWLKILVNVQVKILHEKHTLA